jgi:hypothetical protein
MKPNFIKTRFISFIRKTNVLNYQYRLVNLRTDCIKDLGVNIDCKLHFHHYIDFIFFTCNEIIWVNSYISIFLFYHSLMMLYFASVTSWSMLNVAPLPYKQ